MSITLASYDPGWPKAFAAEAKGLCAAVPRLKLHHIGSTSIPGMLAKPIIDLLGVIPQITEIDAATARFEALGYEALGEFGLQGRRYFRKVQDGIRTHHLHIYGADNPDITRHIAFRDYLRAFPEVAVAYAALKSRLVAEHQTWDGYMDGKDAFIKRVEADALAWVKSGAGV